MLVDTDSRARFDAFVGLCRNPLVGTLAKEFAVVRDALMGILFAAFRRLPGRVREATIGVAQLPDGGDTDGATGWKRRRAWPAGRSVILAAVSSRTLGGECQVRHDSLGEGGV